MDEERHTEMKENQNVSETAEMTKEKPERNSNKKRLRLIGAATVIIIALLIGIGIYQSPASRLSRQLDLGQRYLEEMNYEQAVVVFNNVIEIDPMNVDAYLGLVEVYIRTGDFDTALEYAQKGYELTGDERLKEKIDMIESGNITASNGWTMKISNYDLDELMWYETYIYDLRGRKKSTALYNGAGQLVGQGDWEYDDQGNVVVRYSWESYEPGNPLSVSLCKMEYEYNSENEWIDVKQYGVSGDAVQYTGHIQNEYDSEGRNILRKYYNSFDNLVKYDELEYDSDGKLITEKVYNVDGLVQCLEYEYDSEGRIIGDKRYDGLGDLEVYWEYEYDSEGKWIDSKQYDGSGNLIGEMKSE